MECHKGTEGCWTVSFFWFLSDRLRHQLGFPFWIVDEWWWTTPPKLNSSFFEGGNCLQMEEVDLLSKALGLENKTNTSQHIGKTPQHLSPKMEMSGLKTISVVDLLAKCWHIPIFPSILLSPYTLFNGNRNVWWFKQSGFWVLLINGIIHPLHGLTNGQLCLYNPYNWSYNPTYSCRIRGPWIPYRPPPAGKPGHWHIASVLAHELYHGGRVESLGGESPYEPTKLVHVSLEDGPGHPLRTGTLPWNFHANVDSFFIIFQRPNCYFFGGAVS